MRVSWKLLTSARASLRLAMVFLPLILTVAGASQQLLGQAPLVRGSIDETNRITLSGNVHPLTKVAADLGAVDDSFAVDRLYLILGRHEPQEQALAQFCRTPTRRERRAITSG